MIMKQSRKDDWEKGVAAGATIYLHPLTENNSTNKLQKFNAILSQKRIKLRVKYTSKYSLYIYITCTIWQHSTENSCINRTSMYP